MAIVRRLVRSAIGAGFLLYGGLAMTPTLRNPYLLTYRMPIVDVTVTAVSYAITFGLLMLFGLILLLVTLTEWLKGTPADLRKESDHILYPGMAWTLTLFSAVLLMVNEEAGLSGGATMYLTLGIISLVAAILLSHRARRYFRHQ